MKHNHSHFARLTPQDYPAADEACRIRPDQHLRNGLGCRLVRYGVIGGLPIGDNRYRPTPATPPQPKASHHQGRHSGDATIVDQRRCNLSIDGWFFLAGSLKTADACRGGFSTAAPSITSALGLAVADCPAEPFVFSDGFFGSAICRCPACLSVGSAKQFLRYNIYIHRALLNLMTEQHASRFTTHAATCHAGGGSMLRWPKTRLRRGAFATMISAHPDPAAAAIDLLPAITVHDFAVRTLVGV